MAKRTPTYIGWFGRPGRAGTQTHVVDDMNIPMCKYRPTGGMDFQFCARYTSTRHNGKLIECPLCRELLLGSRTRSRRRP